MCVERQRYTSLNIIIFAIASILTIYPSEVGLYPSELVGRQFFKMSTYTSICFSKNMVLPLDCINPPPPPPALVALAAVCSKKVVLLLIHCLLFPVVCGGGGGLCLMLVFISITLCHPSFVISLIDGGEKAGCFTLIVFLVLCDC